MANKPAKIPSLPISPVYQTEHFQVSIKIEAMILASPLELFDRNDAILPMMFELSVSISDN